MISRARWKHSEVIGMRRIILIAVFVVAQLTLVLSQNEPESFSFTDPETETSFEIEDDIVSIREHKNKLRVPDNTVDLKRTLIRGPGLYPHVIVLPARYFYVNFVGKDGYRLNDSTTVSDDFKVRIDCNGDREVWTQVLNRKDGSFIVRYKVFQSCLSGFRIMATFRGQHIAKSPYVIKFPVHSDNCNCPRLHANIWLKKMKCKTNIPQIENDLAPFPPNSVDFEEVLDRTVERFHRPTSHSFCHYAISDNQIYRKCYGEHVGFHIFPDAILLSLTRKMYLSDMEFIMNLGDWPLIDTGRVKPLLPMFSWCKSNSTGDILLPTYELTEASLEGMGRVSLDIMTVQSSSDKSWDEKIPKLFWRGRDSRVERLDLIKLGRANPELFNVSLTNFFFFRDKEKIYGPKAEHVSFFKFFDFKYQLNIDGTVAAYRLPYLLAGDSAILKTDSPYFEHFYGDLTPWIHYIPVKADLGDLIEKINWAQNNDDQVREIVANARKYAQENLMPLDVFCYHTTLYQEWSRRLKKRVIIRSDMEHVAQPQPSRPIVCDCTSSPRPVDPSMESKDEL